MVITLVTLDGKREAKELFGYLTSDKLPERMSDQVPALAFGFQSAGAGVYEPRNILTYKVRKFELQRLGDQFLYEEVTEWTVSKKTH